MLPQGNDNQTVIEVGASVLPHKHYASDIINLQSRLDGVLNQIKGRVPTEGDTLEKLYNLLISSTVEIIVPNIEARDALDIQNTFTNVFVLGDGSWELYKATSVGTNASFVKLSDSTLINNAIGVEVLTKAMLPVDGTADANTLVMGNDARLTDSRYPLPHKHNISSITGVESLIDTKINNKVSTINVGVLSVNSKTGNLRLQKLDVGLDFVDNTPDDQKPVSAPQKAALDQKININRLPASSVATANELVLGSDPRLSDNRPPTSHTHRLRDIDSFKTDMQDVLVNLFEASDVVVSSVNGKKGNITLTPADVGLKFVNNTADDDKPVSRAQLNAIDTKISKNLLPVSSIAEPDQLVLGSDPRLKNAREPLPHTSDLITDFNESVTSLTKSIISTYVDLDNDIPADTTNLNPGEYTKVVVNTRGTVISGSYPARIHELGINDVYTKSEIDNRLTMLTGPTPNQPGGPAVVNEFGKLPTSLLPDSIQAFEHVGHFPYQGNKSTLYIDELHNTLYIFNGTEYAQITTDDVQAVQPLPDLAKVAKSGDYNDLTNIPNLAKVASTANFYDLDNIPSLANIATTGSYYDLLQRPTLSTVATTGSYNDLRDLPTYQDVATTGSFLDLHNRPDLSQYILKTDIEVSQTKTLNFIGALKPKNGVARWYPERDITLMYMYLTVVDPSSNDIVCELNVNSNAVGAVSVEANINNGLQYELNVNVNTTDYITVNIVQADDGRNLTLTVVYR